MKTMLRSLKPFALILLVVSCDSEVEEGIRVVEYTGTPFTQFDVRDDWKAVIEGNLVTITAVRDSTVTDQITFFNVPGTTLPVSPGYIGDPGTLNETSLLRGQVAIQDWDVSGIMSGLVEGDLIKKGASFPNGSTVGLLFWVDVTE